MIETHPDVEIAKNPEATSESLINLKEKHLPHIDGADGEVATHLIANPNLPIQHRVDLTAKWLNGGLISKSAVMHNFLNNPALDLEYLEHSTPLSDHLNMTTDKDDEDDLHDFYKKLAERHSTSPYILHDLAMTNKPKSSFKLHYYLATNPNLPEQSVEHLYNKSKDIRSTIVKHTNLPDHIVSQNLKNIDANIGIYDPSSSYDESLILTNPKTSSYIADNTKHLIANYTRSGRLNIEAAVQNPKISNKALQEFWKNRHIFTDSSLDRDFKRNIIRNPNSSKDFLLQIVNDLIKDNQAKHGENVLNLDLEDDVENILKHDQFSNDDIKHIMLSHQHPFVKKMAKKEFDNRAYEEAFESIATKVIKLKLIKENNEKQADLQKAMDPSTPTEELSALVDKHINNPEIALHLLGNPNLDFKNDSSLLHIHNTPEHNTAFENNPGVQLHMLENPENARDLFLKTLNTRLPFTLFKNNLDQFSQEDFSHPDLFGKLEKNKYATPAFLKKRYEFLKNADQKHIYNRIYWNEYGDEYENIYDNLLKNDNLPDHVLKDAQDTFFNKLTNYAHERYRGLLLNPKSADFIKNNTDRIPTNLYYDYVLHNQGLDSETLHDLFDNLKDKKPVQISHLVDHFAMHPSIDEALLKKLAPIANAYGSNFRIKEALKKLKTSQKDEFFDPKIDRANIKYTGNTHKMINKYNEDVQLEGIFKDFANRLIKSKKYTQATPTTPTAEVPIQKPKNTVPSSTPAQSVNPPKDKNISQTQGLVKNLQDIAGIKPDKKIFNEPRKAIPTIAGISATERMKMSKNPVQASTPISTEGPTVTPDRVSKDMARARALAQGITAKDLQKREAERLLKDFRSVTQESLRGMSKRLAALIQEDTF